MAERKIPQTEGLEMYLNLSGAIVIKQQPFNDETQIVIINPADVETVRQWLAELLVEATQLASLKTRNSHDAPPA